MICGPYKSGRKKRTPFTLFKVIAYRQYEKHLPTKSEIPLYPIAFYLNAMHIVQRRITASERQPHAENRQSRVALAERQGSAQGM